uniref:fumarate reductase (NADH) n=1 Tax=Globodera rostochiensis TaxID=31243 RepID=A0A914HGJ1_GLORO
MADVNPQQLDPALSAEKAPKKHEPVIVVGGGLAGMAATLEALSAGAHVILIDKEPMLGGNSAKASSGINGCGTKVQKILGIADSPEKFYSDTMLAGDRENNAVLVDVLVHESTSAVHFLIEQGVELADINLCGGHSVPRTHWLLSPKEGKPLPVGVAIIRAMKSKLDEWKRSNPEKFEVLLGTSVLGLVTWNDYVTGVRVRGEGNKISEINGKAVILTTGGFSSDRDNETSLLTEFAPDVLTLPTTNGPFATGDGVKMARAMGASLVGMKRVQIHPTAFIDPKDPSAHTKFLAAEALRGKGAILINENGKRFGNELGRRDYLTEKINKNCARQKSVGDLPVAWMLMNNASADSFGRPAFNFYAKIKGFFTAFANADELASAIGCSVEQLHKTFAEYNEYVEMSESDEQFRDPFGKKNFPFKFDPGQQIFAAKVTPAIHYTMGGLQIDKKAVVFNEFMGRPFQGLLAAGEVTGGVHGNNRLAGNSLLECVVFGRIAGQSAAEIDYQSAIDVQFVGRNSFVNEHTEYDEREEL